MKNKRYQLVNAADYFDDNNKGYIYGIHWLDRNGNIIEAEWHKTKKQRRAAYRGISK